MSLERDDISTDADDYFNHGEREPEESMREHAVRKSIWYLAHPVAPDARYTFDKNMAHALKVARICHDAGFKVCPPWYAACLYLDDANPEHRAAGLAMDVELAANIGRIILTGHRISSGMQQELDAVRAVGGDVIDATGVPDDKLASFMSEKVPA